MTQDLTEPEVALDEVKDKPTPLGPRHLHWVHNAGASYWLVRGAKKSPLCGTPRCREVVILEVEQVKERLEVIIRPFPIRTDPRSQEGYREF